MNPHPDSPQGGEDFPYPGQFRPQGSWQGAPSPQGRYGGGLLAVLTVIAILAGASTLGGTLAIAGAFTDRVAAAGAPDPTPTAVESDPEPSVAPTHEPSPTPEPTEASTEEPSEGADAALWDMTAEEVVTELRERHDDLTDGLDVSDELCVSEEEDDLFVCTMAVETNLVRVISYENSLVATTVVLGLRNQEEVEDAEGADMAVDFRSACHIVLIWFERGGMEESDRGAMTDDVEGIVGC
ncbi:hypothetical protein ACWGSK_04575 [Nocardiopsis sp. NPDC055551]|uniref:hypothetical protein n=1 Tax=Nocardiopsis sp. NPDC006832 TaxID=3157188 RepID=UPI0033D6580B